MQNQNCETCERLQEPSGYLLPGLMAVFVANSLVTVVIVSAIGPRTFVNNNEQHVTITRPCYVGFESAETQDASTGHPERPETQGEAQ